MLKKLYFILILISTFLLLGLNSNVNAETKFSFVQDSDNVSLNGTKYLLYSGGTGKITWTSGDTSIATVDNGNVRGLKIGETTITATRGDETATCKVKVVYDSIQIGANEYSSVSKVNLVLNEHDTETLIATVKDGASKIVNDAVVNWKSSDSSIVTIDSITGKMKAVKSGTATITVEAAGVSKTCNVTVYDAPYFTDFKNAKYETSLNGYTESLKISGVTPKDSIEYNYYYIITSSNTKPELIVKHRKNRHRSDERQNGVFICKY